MKLKPHEIEQIQLKGRKIMRIIVTLMFAIIASVLLSSCSVRKKEVTKEDTKTEIKKDSSIVSVKDSSKTIEEAKKETVTETEIDFNGGKDLVIQDNNSITRISGSGKVKIKRIDINSSNKSKEAVKTSENINTKTDAEEKKQSIVKNKTIKDTGFNFIFYIWLFLLIIVLVIIYYFSQKCRFFS